MASFTNNITAFIQKTGLKADIVLRKIAFDGFTGVVVKSPVDTGRFRASWRVGINTVDLTVEPERFRGVLDPEQVRGHKGEKITPPKSQSPVGPEGLAVQSKLLEAKFGVSISITNNIVYGPPLERGHSRQAPQGMLQLTLLELQASLAAAVATADNPPADLGGGAA